MSQVPGIRSIEWSVLAKGICSCINYLARRLPEHSEHSLQPSLHPLRPSNVASLSRMKKSYELYDSPSNVSIADPMRNGE